LEAEPVEDADVRCRGLIAHHKRYLSDVAKSRLLALTTERLAARGARDQARVFFAETQCAIAEAGAAIACPATRKAYTERAAAPLQRAVAATPDGIPLFIVDAPSSRVPRGKSFAFATVVLGTIALFAAVICTILDNGGAAPLDPHSADGWFLIISWCWLMALVSVLFSMLRSERRFRTVTLGFVLATLAAAIAIAAGIPGRESRSSEGRVIRSIFIRPSQR
jgi:hypothetical protein